MQKKARITKHLLALKDPTYLSQDFSKAMDEDFWQKYWDKIVAFLVIRAVVFISMEFLIWQFFLSLLITRSCQLCFWTKFGNSCYSGL